jgi:replication-associated recombination protein RarA
MQQPHPQNPNRIQQLPSEHSHGSRSTGECRVSRLTSWHDRGLSLRRPKDLNEVKAQDHVVDVLKRMLNYGNMPHLLLYGSPGNGKTSTILALARSLYGPQLFYSRVLELNASDERGISIIRTKVKVENPLQRMGEHDLIKLTGLQQASTI